MKKHAIAQVMALALASCMYVACAAAEPVSWPDMDCGTCHTAQMEALEKDGSLAQTHNLPCVACHTDSETLGKMHENVEEGQRIPKSLKKTVVESEKCLTCHSFEDASSVAGTVFDPEWDAKTKGEAKPQASAAVSSIPMIPFGVTIADSNGLAVDVHAVMANDDHVLSIHCGSCHNVHSKKAYDKQAKALCTTCHHKNVFECHTCH